VHVGGRPEGDRVVDVLGGAVDPAALGAVEGQLLAVHGVEILAKELAEALERVAKTADYRKIAPYRVLRLPAVGDVHDQRCQHQHAEEENEQRGQDFQRRQRPARESIWQDRHRQTSRGPAPHDRQ
jgi:hypothetical protein